LDETLADDFRSIPINRHSPDPSAGGLELASDPLVPWYAKALGLAVAAYALSPIDLIPDFGIALVVSDAARSNGKASCSSFSR
jgi:hypothetical protein